MQRCVVLLCVVSAGRRLVNVLPRTAGPVVLALYCAGQYKNARQAGDSHEASGCVMPGSKEGLHLAASNTMNPQQTGWLDPMLNVLCCICKLRATALLA